MSEARADPRLPGMVSDPLTKLAYTAGRRLRAEFPMQILCPNCATAYDVQPAALGASGRSVRCVRCRNVWFVHDPAALAAIAQDHRSDVDALAAAGDEPGALESAREARRLAAAKQDQAALRQIEGFLTAEG